MKSLTVRLTILNYNMLKKRIYIDVDDVLSMTTITYPGIVQEQFGKKVSFESLTCFDLMTSFDLVQDEFNHLFDLIHQPDLLLSFEIMAGAKQTLQVWSAMGYVIEIVTGRPESAREVTLEWLENQEIPYDEFIMVDKYNRQGKDLGTAITKAELAQRSYDLAVEDSGDMALFLAGQMGVNVALIDQPWNRGCSDHDNLVRCMDWHQVRKTLHQ